ncbi:MAG: LPS export ABC transporter permease LptG [Alphaproteobacteria bacterium]|nr:LPS export ABC transporter permease LptG [Alphaproteobacteria bacterium]
MTRKKMNPTSILGRYLTKQLLGAFLGVLLMIIGIIFMFDMIELLRRTAERPDVEFSFILKMAFSKLPRTFELVFPFVMMIAAMITFWKISRSNEFVIIRAAGVSIWGVLIPILSAVFVVGMINITVINPISSYLYEVYETMDYRFKTRNPNAVLFSNKGLWIREATDEGNVLVLEAKSVRQEDDVLVLRTVSLLELDENSFLVKRAEAYAAELRNDEIEMKDVKIFETGKPTVKVNNYDYKTTLTVERIKENFIDPEAISFWNLPDTIEFYEKSGFSVVRHKMRYLSLWASPFLLMAMVLVAAVFALRGSTRGGGVMFLIVGGITTGFVVYFLSQIIYAFGINNYIPIMLAVWAPALIITMISSTLLLHLDGN